MFSSRRRYLSSVDAHIEQLLDGASRLSPHEAIAGPCDRCPAAAAVRVQLPSGSLLMLCGHHARRYASALLVQGAVVTGGLALVDPCGQSVGTGAG
jgi:hypothetical protein